MKARTALRRTGVAVSPAATIADAAAVMEHSGTGTLAVIDGEALVGVVTDRDLVRRALATGLASDARVDAVMSTPVVTIDADEDVHHADARFRHHAVRRLAVVDGPRFIGMLSIDDLLLGLADDLTDLSRPVSAEMRHPQHDSPTPAVR